MAGNLLRNAGLVDLTDGWASGGGALQIDDTTVGAPGRAVLVAGAGGVASASVAVSAGDDLEVMALAGSDGVRPRVEFVILDGGGATAYAAVAPYQRLSTGSPRRGLSLSFSAAYLRLTAPISGQARVSFSANGGAMSHIYAYRPYIGRPGLAPARWDPGVHANPDLQLPVWPADLPGFRGQVTVDPYADLKAFAGDVGIPTNSRTYSGLQHQVRGQMRLTQEQDDVLARFYDAGAPEFYFVRPDTDELCIATWLADGTPRLVEMKGQFVFREVGLRTRLA